jgi:predicted permease
VRRPVGNDEAFVQARYTIGVIQTARIACRSLGRTPGFAATAVATLALGIGLSVAVFTVAEALLLRKLPFHDQDRLVVLWGQFPDRSSTQWPLELDHGIAFARGTTSLERAAYYAYEGAWPQPIRDGDRITRLRQALVSGDYFGVLGADPILGRTLRLEDDVVGAAPVVVLGHGAWQRHFGGDTGVVGRQIMLHGPGRAYTIVGVMPRGFDWPAGTDFWAPLIPARARPDTDSVFAHVGVITRLKPGVSPSTVRDELSSYYRRTGTSDRSRGLQGVVTPLPRLILGDTRPAVLAFAAAALLLLVITCVNVANLLLVRGLTRMREIAVRSALGAAQSRVVSQLLVENALLAAAGGLLGAGVAVAALRTFVAFAPANLPRMDEIQHDATLIAGAVAITAVAMLLFGLAPAILTARVEPQQVLRSGARQSMSRGSRLASETLVAAQVALAVVVLSGAGLITRSVIALERADLAFDPSRLLIGELAFRFDQVESRDGQLALLDRLLPAVRALPGVEAVSPVVAVPFAGPGGWDLAAFAPEGQSAEEASPGPTLNMEVVVPEYFRTFGIEVLEGRTFTDRDREGAPPVIVISRSTARHYWPGESPVGKRVSMGRVWAATVIGVVPDTRYRDLRDARPTVYFALGQAPFPFSPLNLAIRTKGAPADLVPALREAITSADPATALASAVPFDTFLDRPLAQPRLNAFLLTVFAIAAAVLAAIGLFGVMATVVGQRTREFGIRMALGATASRLRHMVLRRGLAIAAAGLSAGLLGALVTNRFLRALLYEVSPTDVVTLAGVSILLLGVATLAGVGPARASTRIDPARSLRAEE